ncbi:ABC transporter ATP-binding protein [Sphingomonas sp. So64.6b]|uniref:ATP-binding cassette domain-containing protein n=1 Tax=Sphingomonas sp. So64.6b TaxID=2997354 RepID=UPI00160431C2|nr:ABC transporter ATP-binding protein [Sphingomonas sp. So64.6b]QNA82831.1 ABC transporter ATP-binding protein [Sphingomonas sp. So64.6b]
MASPWRSAAAFAGAFTGYARWRGWLAAGLVGTGALLEGVSVLLLIPILSVVVSPRNGDPWRIRIGEALTATGATTPVAQLALLLAAFVSVALIRACLLYARDLTLAKLQTGFVEQQRNQVLATLAAAPWSRIVALRHSRITNLLGTEMQRLGGSAQFMIQGTVAIVLLIVQGALAIWLAPGFATAVILLLLVGGVFVLTSHGRSRDLGSDVVKHSQALMGSATGLLGGLKAAAAQNGQHRFVGEFETIQTQLRGRQLSFQRRQARARAGFAIGSSIAGATVVLTGVAANVSPAVLIALVLIFARMSGPAQQIQGAAQNFFFGLPSFEAIRQLEMDLGRSDAPVPVPIAPPAGPVELRSAVFLHPGGGGVREASLTIAPGSFVGVSGPSGAGKTTLIDMLIGLLVPQSGAVIVGGVVLDDARRAGWRETLAYVPQDGFLFHDTVRRNLDWGDPAIDDAAIARALELAGAQELIARLELGLETVIGERGAMLSGGERQRIALARALLRNPRLLVLDEAANAIDADGEAALLARLATLEPRPTIVMISHRAESMALCDRVVRVELGQVTA